MPAQTARSVVPEYAMYDTAPPLAQFLLDGNGDPINLTGATVVINISPTYSGYGSHEPSRLVDGGACVPDPDQSPWDQGGNRGLVRWFPGTNDLDRWGTFAYNFEVTYSDTTVQTISPKGDNVLIVRHPIGGIGYAEPH